MDGSRVTNGKPHHGPGLYSSDRHSLLQFYPIRYTR